MELKVYKLNAKSKLYTANYIVRAVNLKEAGKIAKVRFAKRFGVFGNDVKISIDSMDLENHIDEILKILHN